MLTLAIPDEATSDRAAGAVARGLGTRACVLLFGDLGTGKTAFVRAAMEALDCRDRVRSPTYTVAHEYQLAGGRSVAHLDLYRDLGRDAVSDEWFGDIEPTISAAELVMVEWPDPIVRRFESRGDVVAVHLAHAGGTRRIWTIDARSSEIQTRLTLGIARTLGARVDGDGGEVTPWQ